MTTKATRDEVPVRRPSTSKRLRGRKALSNNFKAGVPIYLVGEPPPKRKKQTIKRINVGDVHQEAMRALRHFAEHGDNTLLSRVVNAIEMPRLRSELIQWCERHAQIRWNRNGRSFKGGRPKHGVRLRAAEKSPFRPISKSEPASHPGIDVSVMWTVVVRFDTRCRVCDAPSILGEDTCYSHHNK